MSSLLERLLITACVMVAPLLAAATTPKKTTAKAAKSRKVKSGRPAREKKKVLRATKKPARPTSSRAAKNNRPGARQKEQEPPAKVAASHTPRAEPMPKPVPPTGRALQLAPENGKYADSIHPKFRWLSVGGATRYEVAWSEHSDLSGAHSVISPATEAVVPVEKPLRVGATYYWRVRGGNEGGWGPWSPAISFQVLEEPPAP
jgi:hypothetical protein